MKTNIGDFEIILQINLEFMKKFQHLSHECSKISDFHCNRDEIALKGQTVFVQIKEIQEKSYITI
jgi:hypothetical protein